MNEAGRRLALFAGGLAAVFGLGLLLGATVGPDAGDPGGGGHDMDEMDHGGMDHPTTTTAPPAPPSTPSPPAGEPGP